MTSVFNLPLMAALAASAGIIACSASEEKQEVGWSDWECATVAVPMGSTFECLSTATSAYGQPEWSAPAYYCAENQVAVECPPSSNFFAEPEFGTTESNGGATNNQGEQTSGTTIVPIATPEFGSPETGSADGGKKAGKKEKEKSPTSPGGTPEADSGGTGSQGAEPRGGFYCTQEDGVRRCRKAPVCKEGAHRLQMDCEPDASSGLGTSHGSPEGGGFPGGSPEGNLPNTQCFYPVGTPPGTNAMPAATFQYVLETLPTGVELHTRLTFSPHFVDNSYGSAAIGWTKGHTFSQLVGSDHAELSFFDKGNQEKIHFKLDYLSKSATAPSGYACLGVRGGEGRMILGDASLITRAMSSLDRNLNERGYASFIVDSPASNATFAAPISAPMWDFRVVYEAWIKNEAFGAGGFGSVKLAFVHASPSKANSNTLPVEPAPCPPGW